MKRQPRLSRSEVIARLRAHAARVGSVSRASLDRRDRIVLRSLLLYFPSFEAARRAARVPAAPRPVVRARRARAATWSRRRVIDELRRLDRSGQSTSWADLMQAGRGDLVGAAATYAGGLQRARILAGTRLPARRSPVPRWSRATIVAAIRERVRRRQTLASSRAPQRFVAAARWHFGSWEAALIAAEVDAQTVRLQRRPYTRPDVVALLRRLARDGTALRATALRRVIKLETVRKLFGSLERAVRAAGLEYLPRHPNQKWSRERVIEELRERAAQGKLTLTRGLHGAVQLYFGGAYAARVAAGLPPLLRAPWTRESLVAELRRRAQRGNSGSTLWSPCKRLFGSVAAARRAAGVPATQRSAGMAAWSKRALLAELRRRAHKRQQLGRGLSEGLRRQFGSLSEARAAAGMPVRASAVARERARAAASRGSRAAASRAGASRNPWLRWSRAQVIAKLQAWGASGGGRLRRYLSAACAHHFGSVTRACAAANVEMRPVGWTPARIRQALREPGFDAASPAFVAACIDQFGSVTAARVEARRPRTWSKASIMAELRARARRGLPGVGRLLREPVLRLFGSTEAALRAAAQSAAST